MPVKKSMFSSTVKSSYSENFCDMYPMLRRMSSGCDATSNPFTDPRPDVGVSRPHNIRMVEENIDFFTGIYGVPQALRAERKDYVLEMANLAERRRAMTRSEEHTSELQ